MAHARTHVTITYLFLKYIRQRACTECAPSGVYYRAAAPPPRNHAPQITSPGNEFKSSPLRPGGSKVTKNCSKTAHIAQRRPRGLPRRSQDCSRRPRDDPTWTQDDPGVPKDGLRRRGVGRAKSPQHGPRGSKEPHISPRRPPRDPRETPRTLPGGPKKTFGKA
eukprot:6023715-Pyramimonas_sp.AAC.1